MAQFGVTTAMVSIVLSVFMAGLGLGSWASGQWLRQRGDRLRLPALRLYAAIELLIVVSGIVVLHPRKARPVFVAGPLFRFWPHLHQIRSAACGRAALN
jgi:hypothetical protein